MGEVDQREASPEQAARAGAGSAPTAARPRPALSWIALGATLLIVVLLARTLAAYPLVPLRLSLGGSAPPTPTLVASQQDSGVPGLSLIGVAMRSPSDGWATGWLDPRDGSGSESPVLLRWNGTAWSRVEIGADITLGSMSAPPDGQLWVASAGVIYSFDGANWTTTYEDPGIALGNVPQTYLQGIDMISSAEGWAVGNAASTDGSDARILHYAKGGWTPVSLPVGGVARALRSVSFTPDGREGWAVGSIYEPTGERGYALHYQGGRWSEADGGLVGGVTGVSLTPNGDVWVVGITSGVGPGYIAHWNGSVWQQATSPTTNQLHAITMLSSDEGYIAGDGAATLHYTNGAWQQEGLIIHGIALGGIAMTGPGEGWAVGGGVMLREHRGVWSVYHLSL